MRTDDEVIEEAIPLIEKQWCQGTWKISKENSVVEGLPAQVHYCAMGAVMKAAQTYVGPLAGMNRPDNSRADAKIDQIYRVARRLADVIIEQRPDWYEEAGLRDGYDYLNKEPNEIVETFNDSASREEMLAIFEKARHSA